MATLRITFTPASPAPAQGYLVAYRKAGTADAYTTTSVFSSPADITVPDGWPYEGYIRSDCGAGTFSPTVDFNAAVVAEDCYIYQFSNTGVGTATIHYKDCGTDNIFTISVPPDGSQVEQCMRSDYVIVNGAQQAPGAPSGIYNNVAYARVIICSGSV